MSGGVTPISARGACPTLAAPMAVADGLLARFRPARGLTPAQLAALGRAADASGNGRIEITARGSVQVRGLSAETEAGFRAALDAAGIKARTGIAVDISPIAGADPKELRDPRGLADRIGAICDRALAEGPLSPKLAIVIVSGGQILLDGLKGDIRLLARADDWVLEAGGQTIGALAEGDVPATVAEILARLRKIGPKARGTDLDGAELSFRLEAVSALPLMQIRPPGGTVGPLSLAGGEPALRIGLPFGQSKAAQLVALAETLDAYCVAEARPAPERTLVLVGFEAAALPDLSPAIAAHGFRTRADAQRREPTICSGAEAAGGGIIHASDLAYGVLETMGALADGSFHIHVSTCTKGCAYAGWPGIVLEGNGLHIYRGAAQKPFARLDPAAIEAGLKALAGRIHDVRKPGETTLDGMSRLGAQ